MVTATIKSAIATGRLEDRSDKVDKDIEEDDDSADEEVVM